MRCGGADDRSLADVAGGAREVSPRRLREVERSLLAHFEQIGLVTGGRDTGNKLVRTTTHSNTYAHSHGAEPPWDVPIDVKCGVG